MDDTKEEVEAAASDAARKLPKPPAAASLLALIRDAATTDELRARLAALAAGVASLELTITKAEVLAAAKAKRAALGPGGGWTKDCALALKAVLMAFGGASGVAALPPFAVGLVVRAGHPGNGSPKLATILEIRGGDVDGEGPLVLRLQLLCDEEVDAVPADQVRRLPSGAGEGEAAVREMARAGVDGDVARLLALGRAELAEGGGRDAAALECFCLAVFNRTRLDEDMRAELEREGGVDMVIQVRWWWWWWWWWCI